MKKLFVIALVLAFASSAMATESRQIALGGAGNYIEDDYNIFAWPGTLPSYANIVWISINAKQYDEWEWDWYDGEWDKDNQEYLDDGHLNPDGMMTTMGATYGLGDEMKYGVLGMFFTHQAPGLNPFGMSWYDVELWPGAGTFGWPVDNKFTIMYGYAMEGLSFGLTLSRSDESMKVEGNFGILDQEMMEGEFHTAYTSIGAGLRFDVGDAAYADLAFDINFASYTDDYVGSYCGEETEDANMMWGVKARMFYEWTDAITWVPYFHIRSLDFSTKYDNDDCMNFGDKAFMFDLGIGANIAVNEDNLIVIAIEPFSHLKREPSEMPEGGSIEFKRLVLPRFIMGLESDVKDWLTFRAGAMKSLVKDEWTGSAGDDEVTLTETYADFNFYMGLGFHVGDFDIDCLLNTELPLHMGYWLTGYQPEDGEELPVYMISAKYHF